MSNAFSYTVKLECLFCEQQKVNVSELENCVGAMAENLFYHLPSIMAGSHISTCVCVCLSVSKIFHEVAYFN